MGKLIKEWVKEILTENIEKKVVVYAGRFQPFHPGHYGSYKHLVSVFGKDNVYIGTSNKTDNLKSPFNFKEKKQIMTTLFDVPPNKIIQIRNPYAPKEILSKFPEETTAFITVVGEKDRYRLKGKYFDPYHPDKIQKPYKDKGYVYVAPSSGGGISGTQVRKSLSQGDEQKRKGEFKRIYGKFNPKIFKLVSSKLYKIESVMESFLSTFDIHTIIKESVSSNSGAGEPEDRYTPPGKQRTINVLGKEQWLNRGGYTQLHFPTADDMYPEGWDDATTELDNREKSAFNPDIDEPDITTDFLTVNVNGQIYSVFDNRLKEGSNNTTLGKSMVDDGPGMFFGNFKSYKKVGDDVAQSLGWKVIDYIMGEDSMLSFDTDYPNGPGRYPVSWFPSGIEGVGSARYGSIKGKEMKSNPAFNKWVKHITNVAITVGYKLIDFLSADQSLNESLLTEGGAYGHMNHPFDIEMNLTFGDLKNIVKGALTGNLELTREKTDGQALAISWRDDRGLIAARNKSHLKNSGENALDISGVASKFQGRGGLTDAYNFAMVDLSNAIKSLSKAQRDKVFQQGSSFMNLEVIYPQSVNVIPYGQPLLVFHGTMQYDVDGKAIGENQGAARMLAGMIKQINQNVQKNYTIQGPPVTQLPKSEQLSTKQSKYLSMIDKLQKEYGLSDSDGVADYHQAWWENWVDKNSPSTLDNKTKMGLVKRWAFRDKSFRLDTRNITDDGLLLWAKKTDKIDQAKLSKDNLRKFENIFLGVGADVLSFMSSVITVNQDEALRAMKKRLDSTISDIKKSGDVKKIQKLKLEMERLLAAGGKQKLVPNEGIVFVYKGNTYKLTGTFAPLNQILGLMYY
jgi:hypothetical protein